jgi:sec-independent protein translocase protein TatC
VATISRLIPERFRWRPRRDRDGTMTLIEHLEELRYRLFVSLIAVAIAAIAAWFVFSPIVRLLQEPYCRYWVTVPPRFRPTQECTFFFFGALEPALIKLKLVGFIALFLALPVILYQLWAFVVPGLTDRERRMAIPFVVSSVLLFALGAAFAYWTLPKALSFLLGFAGQQFAPLLTGDRYLSFVMLVALAFGLSFEFPIVLIFLQLAGVLSTRRLRDWRRGAIVGVAVFAAIITPSQDPYTMLAMCVPMWLFYEASIIVGRLLRR